MVSSGRREQEKRGGKTSEKQCADTENREKKRKKPQNKHRKEISFENYRTVTN